MSENPIRPRLFWRRVGAAVIDYLLASLLVVFSAQVLVGRDVAFEPMGLKLSACVPATGLPPETLNQIQQAISPDRIAGIGLCRVSSFGLLEHSEISVVFDVVRQRTSTTKKTVSFALSADGTQVVTIWPLDWAVLAVLILGAGYLGARGGASPGKAVMGLWIAGPGAATFRRRCLREALRFLPWGIVAFGTAIWVLVWSTQLPSDLGSVMKTLVGLLDTVAGPAPSSFALWAGIGVALLLAVLWYYDWAIIRWRGQMRYDRICNTWVERKVQ